MNLSRRNLLKTALASGLMAAGLAASDEILRPLLASSEVADESGTSDEFAKPNS